MREEHVVEARGSAGGGDRRPDDGVGRGEDRAVVTDGEVAAVAEGDGDEPTRGAGSAARPRATVHRVEDAALGADSDDTGIALGNAPEIALLRGIGVLIAERPSRLGGDQAHTEAGEGETEQAEEFHG